MRLASWMLFLVVVSVALAAGTGPPTGTLPPPAAAQMADADSRKQTVEQTAPTPLESDSQKRASLSPDREVSQAKGAGMITYLVVASFGALCGFGAALYFGKRDAARLGDDVKQMRARLEGAARDWRNTHANLAGLQNDVATLLTSVRDIIRAIDQLAVDVMPLETPAPGARPRVFGATQAVPAAVPPQRPAPHYGEELPSVGRAEEATARREWTRERLGEVFVGKLRSSSGQDFSRAWEGFLEELRGRPAQVESWQVYWDRTASARFLSRPSDSFKDTGTCMLLKVGADCFLFFPKLAESARKIDLPACRIESSDDPVLRVEDLEEFTPPLVEESGDGCIVVLEGQVRYR